MCDLIVTTHIIIQYSSIGSRYGPLGLGDTEKSAPQYVMEVFNTIIIDIITILYVYTSKKQCIVYVYNFVMSCIVVSIP